MTAGATMAGLAIAANLVLLRLAHDRTMRVAPRVRLQSMVIAGVIAGQSAANAGPLIPFAGSARWVDAFRTRAGLEVSSTALGIGLVLALGLIVALGGALAGLVGAVVGLLGAVPSAWIMARVMIARQQQRLVAALPDALESMSRSVRSGASLAGALQESIGAVPAVMARELEVLDRQVRLGQPLTVVLAQWSERQPAAEVRLAVAALSFAFVAGGTQAQVLDGLSISLRDRQALRREVEALSSQAQMSALVMALLPFGFLAVMVVTDPGMVAFLFRSTVGVACLGCGLTLEVIGAMWMRRISRRVH